ncbi:MAG: hypothetical protein GY803_22900 [Chloroflexi bacterium]|nr:hypothetical protein [Chloroflexota bacterium]
MSEGKPRRRNGRLKSGWGAALGAGLFLIWLLLLGGRGLPDKVTAVSQPIIAEDFSQRRANTTLPAPQDGLAIRQSFVPRWDGLREIELLLARHGEKDAGENACAECNQSSRLRLQLFDDADILIAEQTLATQTLTHNQTYTFRVPPQPHSANRRYTLHISGSGDNPVSVWGYSLDVYSEGGVQLDGGALATAVPPTNAQDLYFVSRYQLTWANAFKSLGQILYREGSIMLLALAFLLMPGALLLLLADRMSRRSLPILRANALVLWGAALALGTVVWPLLWLGLTLLGGRWRGWSLWLIFIVGWLIVLFLWQGKRAGERGSRQAGGQAGRRLSPAHPDRKSSLTRPPACLLLLLTLVLATRLLTARDLSFPPWVDSSRHGLITAVMTHSGQFPGSYEPFLPVEDPPYHFGFHTLSASLSLMTGWPLPRLLLFLGQLINGLIPLTTYTAVVLMTRRRRAGLLAAFLVGLPFFFPGYYVTWGRLTQLTAMLTMPVLLAFTWLLVRGGRGWRRTWPLVGLLAAGLFLIHLRVFLFFIPFAMIVWLASFGRNGRWLAAAAGLALTLVSPRITQLIAVTEPANITKNTIPNYNVFPTGYAQAGWEPLFLWATAVALFPLLIAGLRRRVWSGLPLFLTGWTAVLFILLAGEQVGLPSISLVNINSMYITLFLPLAIFWGAVGDRWGRWLQRRHWLLQWLGNIVIGGVLTALLLFGTRQQISILNPQTLLAGSSDLEGLVWMEEHLAETAVFAVNSWKWLGETWAAGDGGAWISPLTGRQATAPPIDHVYNRHLFLSVREFNETAVAITDWASPAQAEWLRQQDVTHIFVGARGGFFDPATLARNPQLELVYGRDGVFIFKIRDGA